MTEKPNIIWLTLDSVRYDHTTMSGYDRNTTPEIRAIADRTDGVSFSSCFSHARSSPASVPSILSGTYPSRHRTYFGNSRQLPSELSLISELLGDVGYRTVALSNNGYASSLTGLDRGFDDFTLLGSSPGEILESAGLKNLVKYAANIRRHSVGFSTDSHAHSAGYLMNELAKEELKSPDEPLFYYIHYNEPHRAYYPPLPYLNRYTDEIKMDGREAASVAMEIHHNLLDIVANGCDLSEAEMEALLAMYDSEIAYTDQLVGELFDVIEEHLGETILVVTADHGELFGEDDMLAHKYSMHNAVLHIPMVIKGISDLSDDGIVQHTDVVRTLLEIAGAETETIQGVDLRTDSREYAISQSGASDLTPLLERNPDYDRSKFCTEEYSVIQDGEHKYSQRPDDPRLYRLPDEETNLIDSAEEQATEMASWLEEWLETEGEAVGSGTEAEVDEEMRSRLADLGYLDHEM
ncbi:sulfatase [Halovenus sp. HT40]|uniref:sulfatase n=1 Tax=Halovenus sp. HT40 TaxID=3126691 RepID=UPI00300E9A61